MVITDNNLFLFIPGEGRMGIIFLLLLLIVSLTSASPLIQGQRNGIDIDLSGGADQTQRSEVKERAYAPKPKIIPYYSNVNQFKLSSLKDSDNLKLRPRRLPYKTVCQLGTCLLHNLGNSLHQLSKTEGKEGSKDANDPYGYGR
uniref:Calcitonin peptide-like domain-containing protein n=1 Tax=Poecilia formosa TaxID=48698 RepID=A0A087XBB5_POEFO